MKIAICQMNVIQGNKDENRKTAEIYIDKAAQNGAHVIVLPEMWTCGYDWDNLAEHKEEPRGTTHTFLSRKSSEHRVYLIGGSLPTQFDNGIYNTSCAYDPNGKVINIYSKIHLISLMKEDRYLSPGVEYRIFEIEQTPAATIICYDLRFPELIRRYTLDGAKILFVPAEWPIQREQHWLTLLRARAIENQIFVVGANMAGSNQLDKFNGHSIVYDPWGEIVAEAGAEPTILYADIDVDVVGKVRERMPVFHDRHSELYRL
ncbi:carbon-nitrogen family hydrolase [Cohnella sp.]|uniref:carbon-nitrogen family hydrolase n=1 Tax=Cohnella sp. TaxID=1883426 RepID=UPI003703D7C2